MLFNSWDFAVFFLAVYAVYLLLPGRRAQNVFLLFAGYYFYAAWDWRFLFLLLFSTLVDYVAGLRIGGSTRPRTRKLWLAFSVCTQLTLLGFFKYYNFFVESLETLLGALGVSPAGLRLGIVLPVGISFYTFQTMSYTIDIYRRELEPTRDPLDYALFASFFPQLIAGPIERARVLLPQITRKRTITAWGVESGVWLLLWGLFKKIVIADNMALLADAAFANAATNSAAQAYLGVLAFAIQIYCDFSGYSDVARGCARLLGFEIMRNFNLPYFATSPREFWQRWHISLSTWLRDYLYIPLGGSRKGRFRTRLNLFTTMLLGGLWHGAAWNFVWWGAYHGTLLVLQRRGGRRPEATGEGSRWRKVLAGAAMFQATLFGWLLFRSNRRVEVAGLLRDDSFAQIVEFLTCFRNGLGLDAGSGHLLLRILLLSSPLLLVQVLQQGLRDHYFMLRLHSLPARALLLAGLGVCWLFWGVQQGEAFIYFQF